jgi:hypothetical protein
MKSNSEKKNNKEIDTIEGNGYFLIKIYTPISRLKTKVRTGLNRTVVKPRQLSYRVMLLFILDNDCRTIKVKNVESKTNIDELERLFSQFGLINKVTFMCDKYNGEFKG